MFIQLIEKWYYSYYISLFFLETMVGIYHVYIEIAVLIVTLQQTSCIIMANKISI